ncbi:MAG: hypothetical protein ABI834_07520 [Ginsengibacter sp.]
MEPKDKPVSSLTWVLISAAGFLVFIGVALFFIFFNDKLSNIKLPVYFFLLVIVGLIAAAFLSGALKSHAKYSGKVYGGNLELGGPVVVFALIIYMGYIFRPVAGYTNLKVTVFGTETNNELINSGMVKLLLNKPDSQKIENGLAEFTDVPTEFEGKEVTIIPQVEGYYGIAQKIKINNNNIPVELHLVKKPDSISISGIVINKEGETVSNAIIVFEDGFITDTTDDYGNFRLTLPFKEGHESRIRIYIKNKMRYNNEQALSSNTSMTLQIHE